MVAKDRENVEVIGTIFTLDFSGKTYLLQPQVPKNSRRATSKQDLTLVQEA